MPFRFSIVAFLISLFNCTESALMAQDQALQDRSADYVIKTWSVEDGLPESSPTDITQTPDGYLWVGTWNGLARFDGLRFTSYHSGNTPEFIVSRISVLYAERDGTLWVGTGGGGLVEFRGGRFRRYGTEAGLQNLFVNGCARDVAGTLWVGTEGGLFRMRGETFVRAEAGEADLAGMIFRLYASADGSVYVNAPGKGLQIIGDEDTVRVIRRFSGGDVVPDNRGRAWYWDRRSVIHRSDGTSEKAFGQFRSFRHTSTTPLTRGGIGICFLQRVVLIREESVTYLPSVGNEKLRANETLFEDREGNIWVGRSSSGLARIRKKSLIVLSTSSGLPNEIVASTTEDRNGALWVGTYRQGLFFWEEGNFRRYESSVVSSTVTVNLLWRDPSGAIWAGPRFSGLVRVNPGPEKRYAKGIVASDVTVVAADVDRDGSLWLATERDGVQRDSSGFLRSWGEKEGMSSQEVSALLCAQDGSTWVGTSANGLNRIVGGRVTRIGRDEGLSSNEVQVLHEDSSGAVWIGTRRGLSRWKNGVILSLHERNGLADETVASILDDGRGSFWFGGTKGIFRVDKRELENLIEGRSSTVRSRSFGMEDGLIASEVGGGGTPRSRRDAKGVLWFVSERGLIRIEPDALEENPVPPPVIVEEIRIDHEPVERRDSVVVGPEHSKIEFLFTGISFRSPSKVRFRYRLDGLENEWQEAASRRFAQYNNLPSGVYTFEVTAANSDGIWNTEAALVRLAVLPPFYATWWFISLVIVFFLTGGPTLYVLRVRSLKREQRRQQEFGRKLIERQEEERRRISRDMHDSLGQELLVLKHRIQSRLRKKKLAKETSSLLNDLSGIVSGTITLVRHISHNLRPPELDRLGLSETIKAQLQRVQSTGVFDLRGEVDDVDDCFEKEDEINVVRIVQEALNNIIKHARATKVSVFVVKNTTSILLKVVDNGIGMHDKRESGPGIGLADMNERARLMGGVCEHTSGENGGTVVTVTFPRNA